ncbi:MAG: polysaccharide pyruvyl transferase CsaB [Oscillospiraceae bacterium]|nr:polysaccharide pyruvyl transferase CsaB [Oscillospiraceae bacterium]
MKILITTMGLDIGGAETHITELCKELSRRGHEVIVVSNGGVYEAEIAAAGIKHIKAPLNRRSLVTMLRSLFILDKVIALEKPDVVHAHARIPAFLCGLLQKLRRFPFVTTAHWVFDTGGILRAATNWGDKTVAVSEDIKKYLTDNYGIPEEDIFVTINGIDTERFSPANTGEAIRREFGIAPETPLAVHVSRLDADRALAARKLIEGAPLLDSLVPGVQVLIAGDGVLGPELREMADRANKALGRSCIIMAGARTDISEIVAAGDVFVGVSRAALEAMSAAKPVILAGNEGYMGIFTEEKTRDALATNFCCRACPETETETLCRDTADALLLSAEERRVLGTAGRRLIEHSYSVARMTDDTLRSYSAAVGPRRVVLSGYFGFGNAGDEAILQSVYGTVRRTMPESEITILSKRPRETARQFGCRSVGRLNPFAVLPALKKCDLLISGGGSLLQDVTSTRSLLYYYWICMLAKRLGKRFMLFSNGIGPVNKPENRRRVAQVAQAADVVTLRDPSSLEDLRQMGVTREDITVTADPVFLMEPDTQERGWEILRRAGVKGPFVAVSLRPWQGSSALREKMARICDGIVSKTGRQAVFFPMMPQQDVQEARLTAALMTSPAVILPTELTVQELMAALGLADCALCMRLHALIFAACMSVPAVGISYDPKLDAYLRLLGLPSAGTPKDLDSQLCLEMVQQVLAERGVYAASLEVKGQRLREKARENEEIFKKLTELI